VKTAILDDHGLFRKSLVMLVNSFDGVEVVAESGNGKEFIEMLAKTPVDVVLLDIQMPGMSGYDVCRLLAMQHAQLKILMISQLTTRESIQTVVECGAHGFISKNSDPDQLEMALHNLHHNGFYLGREMGPVLKDILLKQNDLVSAPLPEMMFTEREKEVIYLAAKEMSSSEIAAKLFIHPRTVETHRNHMMAKTKSKNFIGVVLFALKHNIISFEDI
jgi:DNA-binding NarL/FixJ family response regulator